MNLSLDQDRAGLDDGHGHFRQSVRRFLAQELTPNAAAWAEQGFPDRSFWRKAGEAGILGSFIPQEHGGPGGDFLHRAILAEELGYCPAGSTVGGSLEGDQIAAYILRGGTEEQKQEWLPRIAAGETIIAVAMTEPHAGSDLRAIRTTAVAEGDEWIISGAKTYISSAWIADLVLVACRTALVDGRSGISLILVETNRVGFRRGNMLKKMGMPASDTMELFFDQVRVPKANILAAPGEGFAMMMAELPKERLYIAFRALGAAFAAYEMTLDYVKSRPAFGRTVFDFQNTQFVLADIKTELAMGKAFMNECLVEMSQGVFDNERSAMAKLWLTEMEGRVVDQCLQLHGGAGYMNEFPISQLYTAARLHRIYGGTSEIMRMVIGRGL